MDVIRIGLDLTLTAWLGLRSLGCCLPTAQSMCVAFRHGRAPAKWRSDPDAIGSSAWALWRLMPWLAGLETWQRRASGTTVVDNTIIEWASTRWVDLARHGRTFCGSTCPVAVSSRTSQFSPNSAAGMVNLIGSVWALKSSRKWSSVIGRPKASSSGMASPLRKTIRLRANPEFQSASSISDASGLNHKNVAELTLPAVFGITGEEPSPAQYRMGLSQVNRR